MSIYSTAVTPVRYKDSTFYCDVCKAIVKGVGYLIPIKQKVYCTKHYAEAFKKYWEEEK